MSAHAHDEHPHGSLVNPDTMHEHGDVNVHSVLWFAALLGIIVLSMNASMWAMFRVLQHYERKNDPYLTPLAPTAGETAPEPRLQTTPWTDLRKFRAEQRNSVDGYGWVDEKLGVAHIPIAKAKEMLLQKGIAVRPELADAAEGTHVAASGESNGGRTIPAGQPDRSTVPPPVPAASPTTPEGVPPAAVANAPATPRKPGGGL
ncbi:MAG TPA: hypothetical protein VEL51_07935 [Vicinamibacterales bacterium]|nr:hypothetical protein [Vicinamibacterales bacterium]